MKEIIIKPEKDCKACHGQGIVNIFVDDSRVPYSTEECECVTDLLSDDDFELYENDKLSITIQVV